MKRFRVIVIAVAAILFAASWGAQEFFSLGDISTESVVMGSVSESAESLEWDAYDEEDTMMVYGSYLSPFSNASIVFMPAEKEYFSAKEVPVRPPRKVVGFF